MGEQLHRLAISLQNIGESDQISLGLCLLLRLHDRRRGLSGSGRCLCHSFIAVVCNRLSVSSSWMTNNVRAVRVHTVVSPAFMLDGGQARLLLGALQDARRL